MCEVVKHQHERNQLYMKFANQFQGASCFACPVFPFLFGTTNIDFWWLGTLQPNQTRTHDVLLSSGDEH